MTTILERILQIGSKCSKYMLTLQTHRLLEKYVTCGEPDSSKKVFMKLLTISTSFGTDLFFLTKVIMPCWESIRRRKRFLV